MLRSQTATRKAELRAEMKALRIRSSGVSLPTVIVGVLAIVNTASAVASLACL